MWSLVLVGVAPEISSRYDAEKLTGPAHAIYFATYEAVKHAMGGNKAGEHHPLAAGMWIHDYSWLTRVDSL